MDAKSLACAPPSLIITKHFPPLTAALTGRFWPMAEVDPKRTLNILVSRNTKTMDEFEEIAHTGGKIEFLYENGKGVAARITHSNPWATTMVQLCVSYEGEILDFIPVAGSGAVIPYPQPSIPVFLLSDREGLFGQRCPSCRSYFRSSAISGDSTCPYCGKKSKGIEFLTDNQLKFLEHYCNSLFSALNEEKTISLDLDNLLGELNENRPDWLYPEERQQTKKTCSCRCVYDILGDFGVCPSCGKSNFMEIVNEKFDEFEEQFKDADENVSERGGREVEWEKLTRCVSEFEALANNIRTHLALIPVTPKRRSDINRLSFQRIINASDAIRNWFEIDILDGISDQDRNFLNKMFNRRHVFTHNGGRVDQEYIDNTGDDSVRLNQTIRFRSREIKRLIPLVKKCSLNFIEGYESIS